MRRTLFWTIFTLLGIMAQSVQAGVDFLAPGLVVALQCEGLAATVWLGMLWLALQEGMGNLAFGSVGLIYAAFAGIYFFGRWLFEARNLLFVILLGVTLGILHWAVVMLMASLQNVSVNELEIVRQAVIQAAVFPVEWLAAQWLHTRMVHVDEPVVRI